MTRQTVASRSWIGHDTAPEINVVYFTSLWGRQRAAVSQAVQRCLWRIPRQAQDEVSKYVASSGGGRKSARHEGCHPPKTPSTPYHPGAKEARVMDFELNEQQRAFQDAARAFRRMFSRRMPRHGTRIRSSRRGIAPGGALGFAGIIARGARRPDLSARTRPSSSRSLPPVHFDLGLYPSITWRAG